MERVVSIMTTLFLVEHEVEADRWLPVGLVEAESTAALAEASAGLALPLAPGRFRCLPVDRVGTCRYLEFDPDGVLLDTLL
jgi:hypothetical protein